MLEKLLSNALVKDQKILSYQYKSPYQVLAKAPKNADLEALLGLWYEVGTIVAKEKPRSVRGF